MHFDKLIPKTFDIPVLEDELQRRSLFLPWLPIGRYALDQRSGDGRSVDDLETSQSIRTHLFPNFEMLDAKIASALKKIILNSYFKKKVSLEEQKAQMEDLFLRGRQIVFMIYEIFGVTAAHEAVLDNSDLFRTTLHGDHVQEFDSRCDES